MLITSLQVSKTEAKWLVAMIMLSQLLQMVVGCNVNFLAYRYKTEGRECRVSDTNLKLSLLMYISYFVLFARFFYNAYFQNKKVDRNGSSKQGVEVNNLKAGKASNGALAK